MDEQPAPQTPPLNSAPAPTPDPAPTVPNPTPEAPAAPTAAELPHVPPSWPGALGVYKYSKEAVKFNLTPLVLLWVVTGLLSGLANFKFRTSGGELISMVISSLTAGGIVLLLLGGIRRQKVSFGEALSKGLPYALKLFVLSILVTLSYVLSFLLLVVPFFFVLPRLALVNYFLVDKNMGIIEAYKASWAATKGNATKVWGIILVTIAMAVIAVTIIGIPVSIYLLIMYGGAKAILYEMLLTSEAPASVATPPAPAASTTPPNVAVPAQ